MKLWTLCSNKAHEDAFNAWYEHEGYLEIEGGWLQLTELLECEGEAWCWRVRRVEAGQA